MESAAQLTPAALEHLVDADRELFLLINGAHNETIDFIMYWLSDRLIWIPLYIFLLVLLYRHYPRHFWFLLVMVAATVTLTDQIASGFFKELFQRLRPCHDPELNGLVRTLNGHCGGKFGFISSHASNAFGIAFFTFRLLTGNWKRIGVAMLLWAALVSYSRIYLGVHFPADVIGGMLVGLVSGTITSGAFLSGYYRWFYRGQP